MKINPGLKMVLIFWSIISVFSIIIIAIVKLCMYNIVFLPIFIVTFASIGIYCSVDNRYNNG